MAALLLQAESVGRSFATGGGGFVDVLRGLDLQVQRGERIAILGQSGVGKSTLLQLLGALDRPSSGSIHFDGRALGGLSAAGLARFRNESVGFVFQLHHLLPEFSALENVMMPGLLRGLAAAEMRSRAAGLLGEMELQERAAHPVGKLSGGERQRVAVARALVMEPPLILADEPTGNLDPATGERVGDLLLQRSAARGAALIVVTHNGALAQRMQRQLVLREGRLFPADATP